MDDTTLLKITKQSYKIIFAIMSVACLVSIISSFLVKKWVLRKILLLEIIVTGVNAYMYYCFINETESTINDTNANTSFASVDRLRYRGWSITTPIMLLVLCLVLSYSTKIVLSAITFVGIIVLDYLMLLFGYLGEIGYMNKALAMILGFIPFFIIFYLIYNIFIKKHSNGFNLFLFSIYFIIWTGYGLAYLLKEKVKNLATNFFDLIVKAIVALILSYKYVIN